METQETPTPPKRHKLVFETPNLKLYQLLDPCRPWKLFIAECSDPELIAMLQALGSRTSRGIIERLEKLVKEHALKPSGPSEGGTDYTSPGAAFMKRCYTGYGHESIADCGSITVIIEDVPDHLTMQVQELFAFKGTQGSTRYIDWTHQRVWDPLGTKLSGQILRDWMGFYTRSLPIQQAWMREQHPITEEEAASKFKSLQYDNTILAASCDVLRGFLADGASTFTSWHTDLRQFDEHSRNALSNHPDTWVRDLGGDLIGFAQSLYPMSFIANPQTDSDRWLRNEALPAVARLARKNCRRLQVRVHIRPGERASFLEGATVLASRPRWGKAPKHLSSLAYVRVRGRIDQAGLRDLHRHRAVEIMVPCLADGRFEFEDWYIANLAPQLQDGARRLVRRQKRRLARLKGDPYLRQAYYPLGKIVPLNAWGPLGGWIYLCELRAGNTVHPLVRGPAIGIADGINASLAAQKLPTVPMIIDRAPSRFNRRRGKQTFTDTATGENMV